MSNTQILASDYATDIAAITLADNKDHRYFESIFWSKDQYSPIGIAELVCPYTPSTIKYWSSYSDVVVISAVVENTLDETNTNYNYSFIGKVNRLKQKGYRLHIILEDLGWKFMQKVPNDFRQQYIAGQTLDNAFQAICELLEVEFAYSIEDLSKLSFSADGYSIEKDGVVIEEVPDILTELDIIKKEDTTVLDKSDYQSTTLINKKNELNQQQSQSNDKQISSLTAPSQQTTILDDINNIIDETSVQMKIEQYQKEFDDKIKDLFIGNRYYESNLIDNVLSYGNITVNPQGDTSSTSISEVSEQQSTSGQSTTSSRNPKAKTNNTKTSPPTQASARSQANLQRAKNIKSPSLKDVYNSLKKFGDDVAYGRY